MKPQVKQSKLSPAAKKQVTKYIQTGLDSIYKNKKKPPISIDPGIEWKGKFNNDPGFIKKQPKKIFGKDYENR
jgi:hypothetical protein